MNPIRTGWKCCCCGLPVLRPDGPCVKRRPEKYAQEAAALVDELLDTLFGLYVSSNPEAVRRAAEVLVSTERLKASNESGAEQEKASER